MAIHDLDEEAIFNLARKIDSPEAREVYLRQVCGGDEALLARVQMLLKVHDREKSFLAAPAPGGTVDELPLTERPGTVIGPYKLLQQIGEGGMGVVYMAEQQEPVRRKVALKIIKPGLDSQQVIARFEAERQALALMDHPNIARVLDAGTTASGRPFFVMELVHGVPITQFCDDTKLTPRERLALFVPVCHAVQHAHQKGIIHRDLKPSNVLVTLYDDTPVPKVIDFGVAKAVEQRLTDKTMFTHFGTLVGTFEYMSPEQAEMNAFGVDTRSDIYSLGVLLYELLTGTTPLERQRARAAALDELVRLIREEEAPRPSKRLSTSNTLPKIAAARKTEPARLLKQVRGEIDWIVMKCLEKERSRRYETANGLARDVERYLADEPVEACPPSASYRLRKFARKYKKALATVAAFAALLVAGVVLSTALAVWAVSAEREANRQRVASEEARGEAEENFEVACGLAMSLLDTAETRLSALPQAEAVRRDMTVAARATFNRFLPQRPADRELRGKAAKVCRYAANVHRNLSEFPAAVQAYHEALGLYEGLADEFPADESYRDLLANTLRDYSQALEGMGRLRDATDVLGRSVEIAESLRAGARDNATYRRTLALSLLDLSHVLHGRGRYADEEAAAHRAVELLAGLVGTPPRPTDELYLAMALTRRASARRERGQRPEALADHADAVARYKGLRTRTRDNANVMHLFARALVEQSKTMAGDAATRAQAEANLDTAIQIWTGLRQRHAPYPKYREYQAIAHTLRGSLRAADAGKAASADDDFQQAQAILEKLIEEFPGTPAYRGHLGRVYAAQGRADKARGDTDTARNLMARAERSLSAACDASPDNAADKDSLDEVRRELGRPRAGERAGPRDGP
jgi:serine/threonine protein kinase/tetratricopeptide (TPR) repeat protein